MKDIFDMKLLTNKICTVSLGAGIIFTFIYISTSAFLIPYKPYNYDIIIFEPIVS